MIVTSKNSYHNNFSKWGKIRCGVPQGSVLGPLLFFFYINDLTKIVGNNSKPIFCADDTSLSLILTTQILIKKSHVYTQLNEWCAANLLSLH
jgi:hypothetical protein